MGSGSGGTAGSGSGGTAGSGGEGGIGYLFILNISIINFTLKYIILTTCKTGGAGIGSKSCGGKGGIGYSQKHYYYHQKVILKILTF